jgi:hypothetical protein
VLGERGMVGRRRDRARLGGQVDSARAREIFGARLACSQRFDHAAGELVHARPE